ncbi:MAG TPA: hypothetical protein VGB97_02470 [Candidatus Paceibacterota bacterium]
MALFSLIGMAGYLLYAGPASVYAQVDAETYVRIVSFGGIFLTLLFALGFLNFARPNATEMWVSLTLGGAQAVSLHPDLFMVPGAVEVFFALVAILADRALRPFRRPHRRPVFRGSYLVGYWLALWGTTYPLRHVPFLSLPYTAELLETCIVWAGSVMAAAIFGLQLKHGRNGRR